MEKKTNLDDYLADLGISEASEETTPTIELISSTQPLLNAVQVTSVLTPLEVLKQFLEGFVQRLDPSLSVRVRENNEALEAEILGAQASQLIGREGRTLHALETLAYAVVAKNLGRADIRIHIDAANYRRRHEERLVRQAAQISAQVLKSGEPLSLDPMSPADRRIIHMALRQIEGIETHSEGEGATRHIVVTPVVAG